jgi:hypothetical protein
LEEKVKEITGVVAGIRPKQEVIRSKAVNK